MDITETLSCLVSNDAYQNTFTFIPKTNSRWLKITWQIPDFIDLLTAILLTITDFLSRFIGAA